MSRKEELLKMAHLLRLQADSMNSRDARPSRRWPTITNTKPNNYSNDLFSSHGGNRRGSLNRLHKPHRLLQRRLLRT